MPFYFFYENCFLNCLKKFAKEEEEEQEEVSNKYIHYTSWNGDRWVILVHVSMMRFYRMPHPVVFTFQKALEITHMD